jgi:broad specificity phosphatase PhoE
VFADGVVPGDTPGETIHQVAGRVRGVIDRVLPLLERGDVALVGHGHALRVLASVYLEQDPCFGAQLALDAGSVSVLGFEHGMRALQTWNRTLT